MNNWDYDNIQRSMLEIGGKELAKRLIISWIEQNSRSTPNLIATMVGLPITVTMQLLTELGQENCVYCQRWHNLRLYRVL